MKARVFVLPNGEIQIFVDEGTFAEAQVATRAIVARLGAEGVPAEIVGAIEQHRADVTHVHIHQDEHHHH
jgi:hypothetical protein